MRRRTGHPIDRRRRGSDRRRAARDRWRSGEQPCHGRNRRKRRQRDRSETECRRCDRRSRAGRGASRRWTSLWRWRRGCPRHGRRSWDDGAGRGDQPCRLGHTRALRCRSLGRCRSWLPRRGGQDADERAPLRRTGNGRHRERGEFRAAAERKRDDTGDESADQHDAAEMTPPRDDAERLAGHKTRHPRCVPIMRPRLSRRADARIDAPNLNPIAPADRPGSHRGFAPSRSRR